MDQFPRWKYRGSEAVIVNDGAAETALGDQWGDVPGYGNLGTSGAAKAAPAPSREELLEQAASRGIKADRRWSASRIAREIQAQTEPQT